MNPFLVVAIIGGFCALAVYSLSEAIAPEPVISVPQQYEMRLIELDRQAVDDAYRAQVQALFQTWMKDGTGQPERAVRGANQARKAYVASMTALEERIKKQETK